MLTVSIVSHRQGPIAQGVLDDLSTMDARVAHVIVTHNVPEGWEPRLSHPSARLTVLHNARPKGFGANHNTAFAACETPFFAVLNPDLVFHDAHLPELLTAFEDPSVGAVSPTILDPDGTVADFERDLMTLPNLLRRLAGAPRRPGPPVWVAGMCLVLREGAFREVGGFDERYYMYCEDADLCGRLALRGWSIMVDHGVQVVHDARRLSLRSPKRFGHHIASLLRYWATSSFWRHRAQLAAIESAERPR